MANGELPSVAINRALQQGTQNVLQLLGLKQQRELTERRLSQEEIEGDINILRLASLFEPEGTTVATASPLTRSVLARLGQRLGVDGPLLPDDFEVRPETLQGAIEEAGLGAIADNEEFRSTLGELAASTEAGRTRTVGEHGLAGDITDIRQAGVGALELAMFGDPDDPESTGNPKIVYDIGAAVAGAPYRPRFTVNTPDGPQEIEFESVEAGTLAMNFARIYQAGEEAGSTAYREHEKEIVTNLQDVMERNGFRVPTYGEALRLTRAELNGELTDEFIENNPDIAVAAQLIKSGSLAGQGSLRAIMHLDPLGRQYLNLRELIQDSESLNADETAEFLGSLTEVFSEYGFNVPKYHEGGGLPAFGPEAGEVEFTDPRGREGGGGGGGAGEGGNNNQTDPRNDVLQAAAELYAEGEMTLQDLRKSDRNFSRGEIQTIIQMKNRISGEEQ